MLRALLCPLQGAVKAGNDWLCATAVASALLLERGKNSKPEDS